MGRRGQLSECDRNRGTRAGRRHVEKNSPLIYESRGERRRRRKRKGKGRKENRGARRKCVVVARTTRVAGRHRHCVVVAVVVLVIVDGRSVQAGVNKTGCDAATAVTAAP